MIYFKRKGSSKEVGQKSSYQALIRIGLRVKNTCLKALLKVLKQKKLLPSYLLKLYVNCLTIKTAHLIYPTGQLVRHLF